MLAAASSASSPRTPCSPKDARSIWETSKSNKSNENYRNWSKESRKSSSKAKLSDISEKGGFPSPGPLRRQASGEKVMASLSEEITSLRVWLDVTVVQRLAHVDRTMALLQKNMNDLASPSSKSSHGGSKSSNGSAHAAPGSNLSDVSTTAEHQIIPIIENRCNSRTLPLPFGDYETVDMDYIWSPAMTNAFAGQQLPKAGPPKVLLDGTLRVGEEGDPCNSDQVNPTMSCNADATMRGDLPTNEGNKSSGNTVAADALDADTSSRDGANKWHECSSSGSSPNIERLRRNSRTLTSEDVDKLVNKIQSHEKGKTVYVEALWSFLDDPESSRAALAYLRGMSFFALLALVVSVFQSMDPPPLSGVEAFLTEIIFEFVFLLEFIVRLIVCPDKKAFALNMHNVFDLTSALPLALRIYVYVSSPDYLTNVDDFASNVLIGIVPMLRVLKTLRGFKQLQLLLEALSLAAEALPICLFAMLALTLSFSGVLFVMEPRHNIESLPKAMWFTIVTMTTLGYGDMTPTTTGGYLVTSCLVVCSVMFMAMPLAIIGQAFTTVWSSRDHILLVHGVRTRLRMWGYKATDIPILFSWYDDDNSGELELPEFKQMIDDLHIGLSDVRIAQLFESIDQDGGGSVDDREFVKSLFPQYYTQLYDSEGEGSTAEDLQG